MHLPLVVVLIFVVVIPPIESWCKSLLTCAVKNDCIRMDWLKSQVTGIDVSSRLYEAVNEAIDYVCIYTRGCADECFACPLCKANRLQAISVLGGVATDKCPMMEQCAISCVSKPFNLSKIDRCSRDRCAKYCVNGSCPQCRAFARKLFNKACITGKLTKLVTNFQGHCRKMFAKMISSKFGQIDSI